MKYVVMENIHGFKAVVMFSEHLTHKLVADGITYTHRMAGDGHWHPSTAGFINPRTFEVSGGSESLGLESDPNDKYYAWGGDTVAMLEPGLIAPLYEKAMADARKTSPEGR